MKTEWQKPKSTRLYFHPPRAERMFTLWREGKIIFGEVGGDICNYESFVSSGIWFVDGNEKMLDFKKANFKIHPDGIPTHTLENKLGNLDFSLEVFATPERRSQAYIKLTVKNSTASRNTETLKFILRTEKECKLVYESPDIYAPYSQSVESWLGMKGSFKKCDSGFFDSDAHLSLFGDIPFEFDECRGVATASITLDGGECAESVFVFDKGGFAKVEYENRKADTLSFWQGELNKITNLPESFDDKKKTLVKNLTVQLLQCFCYPNNEDFLLSRQGGLQRQIWTYESTFVLEALARIGDFNDYIDEIIDCYFNDFYTDSGEVVPLGISWAMITGNVLYSFGKYALTRGEAFFAKYKDKAYRSFLWMKDTRAMTKPSETVAEGIFPPKSSCDDPLVFQSWCNTDTFNLRGIRSLADAFAHFGDARAAEIESEYNSYLLRMRELWRAIADRTDANELAVPYSPLVPDEIIYEKFAFGAMAAYMVEGLDMDLSDTERILNYYTRRGVILGGLYNRMPHKSKTPSTRFNLDKDGKCVVYYVCCHEYYWFKYFMRHGMRDKCEEILRDNEKYAITDEYYMLERYNKNDPWFAPWSPNASANGRTINMLLDFYG